MTIAYLLLAVVFEVGWATALKLSQGFTRPGAAVVTVVAYVLSLVFLALATKRMDIGPAYAVWAGAGTAIIAVIGIFYFREPATAVKTTSIALIVLGIVGLQLSGGGRATGSPARTAAGSR